MLIGAIEAGGTKFVCSVLDEFNEMRDRCVIRTRGPEETLAEAVDFFRKHRIDALGVGAFGPIDLNDRSKTYGMIKNTPKSGWKYFPLRQELKRMLGVPVAVDTDVNAACLGEFRFGAGRDADSAVYITVGTGVGAGFVKGGKVFKGLTHPEMGHIKVSRMDDDSFEGVCPYHGDCLEGLVSGPAIEKRAGINGADISVDNPVWASVAHYIAQALVNYTLVLCPERIIIGGGVMKQSHLYPMIRKEFQRILNDYITIEDIESYITPPKLDDDQGVIGAAGLAKDIVE
ncbi:ROK family protein [Salinicoccus carnicancri]|uniref:ROK family protein n=1 Tax=Salinicoccus carnicancri TaxID=558170 RepID=UPI000309FBAD|nr:ROK family protein [Salinicoccus carnicancri]